MKEKLTNIPEKKIRNQKNYMSWFEFWHPRKAATMAVENEYNDDNREANAVQDRLEAETTLKLTEQERILAEKQLETYQTIGIAVVIAIIVFVVIKYV